MLSVNNMQLRNIGGAKCIVCPTNHTVCWVTALSAYYIPTPRENRSSMLIVEHIESH